MSGIATISENAARVSEPAANKRRDATPSRLTIAQSARLSMPTPSVNAKLQETAECAEYSREIRPGSRLLSNLWAWLVRQAKNLLPYVPLH
jgi:hypothetical protein